MFQKREERNSVRLQDYASSADFCRLFVENADGLFLLSLLLNADQEKAVGCFLASHRECRHTSGVFKQWAESWSRRTIIKTAIRMIAPRPADGQTKYGHKDAPAELDGALAAVQQLSPFERFVYVMSVLEKYTVQETAIQLECTKSEVIAARTKALQLVAQADGETWPIITAPEAVYAEGHLASGQAA
jgi:hypothetical protein